MTTTPQIDIYTTQTCPFCRRAKALLSSKGVTFTEIDVGAQPDRRAEMVQRANGRRTVPQIFIGGHHVGGCEDLHALNDAGKLDPMLAGQSL